MKRSYKHLSLAEREEISVWKAEGFSLREIARRLGRDVSSISRELKRNAPPLRPGRYLPARAHLRSTQRNQLSRTHLRLKKPEIRRHVLRKLHQGLSPEQIAGHLRLQKSNLSISHEAVYQFIYSEARNLIPLLARSHRKRLQRWHSHKHRKSHIPERTPISQRPAIVQTRCQFGHWEADTIISRKSKASLLVMVERKSRFVKLAWLPQKSASKTRAAINRRLTHFSKGLRRTITYDNGSENIEHLQVNALLATRSFFCLPFHSWEKGTVENTNGLVRRFYPKKTDFATITPANVRRVERNLNSRPRKCLRFKTPEQVFRLGVALTG
jgi:transposase, IS30 family